MTPQANPRPHERDGSRRKWYRAMPWETIRKAIEVVAWLAVIGYAYITYQQWGDLRRHFEIDQRAWLKAEFNLPDRFPADGPMQIRIKNVGKSVALRAVVHAKYEFIDRGSPPPLVLRDNLTRSAFSSQFPSVEYSLPVPAGQQIVVSDADIQALNAGQKYLVLFGHIENIEHHAEGLRCI
jgi:hypothetical protein